MDIFRKRTRETAEAIKEAVGEAIQKSKVRDVDFATITNADAINAFKTNPYVYSAWSLLASDVASVGIDLLDPDDKVVSPKTKNPYTDILKRPNDFQSGSALIEQLTLDLIGGSAFAKITFLDGKPRELIRLDPLKVEVQSGAYIGDVSFRYGGKELKSDEVVFIRMPSISDDKTIKGMSPLTPGSAPISLNDDGHKWNSKLLKNSGKTSAIIKVDNSISPRAVQEWGDSFEEGLGLRARLGGYTYLRQGMDMIDTGQSNRDLDFYNLHTLSAREIAIVLHVPPELLGDAQNKTYSNVQEAYKAVGRHAIGPMSKRIVSALSLKLLAGQTGYRYAVDDNTIPGMSEDNSLLWTRIISARQAGLITYNEAREALGYGPIDGGERLTVPMGHVPIEDATAPLPDIGAIQKDGEELKKYME